MGIEFGIIPVPERVAEVRDTIRPSQPVPTPIDVIVDEAPLAPQQSETSTASRTNTPLDALLARDLPELIGFASPVNQHDFA